MAKAAPWTDPAARPLVRFDAVSKHFGATLAVDALSLDIYPGEFFALLGPSGCGKTTLMRMLAGFERVDSGRILLDGADLADAPPHKRPVNMMFQSYALFPHMNVEENIAFGLKQAGMAKADMNRRIAEMLALGRLEALAKRRPDQLSGGQRQRVALVRALARRPKVLLLDEPLGALDRKLREETQAELMHLQRDLGMTFIMVTHDQDEAMGMADRIGVMQAGRLAQVAPPEAIYEAPASRYVAGFVGDMNFIEGRVSALDGGRVQLSTALAGEVWGTEAPAGLALGAPVTLAIRPEKLTLTLEPPPEGTNAIAGRVWDMAYQGDTTLIRVKAGDAAPLKVVLANRERRKDRAFAPGDAVFLHWAPEAGLLLPEAEA